MQNMQGGADARHRDAAAQATHAAIAPGKHTLTQAASTSADGAAPVQRAEAAHGGAERGATGGDRSAPPPHGTPIHHLFGRPGDRDPDVDSGDDDAPIAAALVQGKPRGAAGDAAAPEVATEPTATASRAPRPLTIAQATARYAPLVYLAPGETHRPGDASRYIQNSRLRWSHDSGQPDDEIADKGHVDARRLGDGGYSDQVENVLGIKHGDAIRSNQDVRPNDGKGDGGDEGFFLDLDNSHHESTGPGTNMPVYYEAVAGHYITYWFFYNYNEGPAPGGIDNHEGDWERISVKLDENNRATAVAYYQHKGDQVMRWSKVPKAGSHPVVYSAKGSHASYASPGDKDLGVPLGLVKDHAGRGAQWKTWQHLQNARAQAWYGYGGAWGEVGDISDTTGPQGPSRYKAPAPEGW